MEKEKIKEHKQYSRHPLFGTSIVNWIRLRADNGRIDREFLSRAAFITTLVLLMTPLRLAQRAVYGRRIAKTDIKHPPIFIIGHWRSGTTYIHELISQDPQLAHVSLWNTLVPESFLILQYIKKFLARFLPTTRPMDSIKVDIDGPYEEEAGMAALVRWSFFHCLIFPRNAEHQFRQSVLFEDLSHKDITLWKKKYLWFLKAVTYANKGHQLILKNPANTSRIATLLELFPNAFFIHIYRNPYKVYLSTKSMRKRVLSHFALQKTTSEELEKHVITNYSRLMQSFFEQQHLIPAKQMVEISYEELVDDPIEQIQKIYKKFNFALSKSAELSMKNYLKQQSNYKTNVYTIEEKKMQEIEKHWSFTIGRWGYKPPNQSLE